MMKKTILFGCMATLMSVQAFAQVEELKVPEVEVKEVIAPQNSAAETLKAAYIQKILNSYPNAAVFYDLEKTTIVEKGADFELTVPAKPADLENKTPVLPDLKMTLTPNGEFNGETQYKISNIFDNFLNVWKSIFPDATVTTTEANVDMTWVPAYQLDTKSSINTKGINIVVPETADIKIDSVIADSLAHLTGENKMDMAFVSEIKNAVATIQNMIVSIPSITSQGSVIGSPITGVAVDQLLNSEKSTYKQVIPSILLKDAQNPEPLLSLSVNSEGKYENALLDFKINVDHIALMNGLPVPQNLVPTAVTADVTLRGLDKESFRRIDEVKNLPTEEKAKALDEIFKKASIIINLLEVKNNEGGVGLTGTFQTKLVENVATPEFTGEIAITNLDKLSPEPKVDETLCQDTKARVEQIEDKVTADQMVAMACTPKGGMLDFVRPFLKPAERTINQEGATLDKIQIQYTNGVLTLNGQNFM